jgi:hypothetical protein
MKPRSHSSVKPIRAVPGLLCLLGWIRNGMTPKPFYLQNIKIEGRSPHYMTNSMLSGIN